MKKIRRITIRIYDDTMRIDLVDGVWEIAGPMENLPEAICMVALKVKGHLPPE